MIKADRRTKEDILFDVFNYILLALILVIVLYPLYFVVIASISDPNLVESGKVTVFPKGVTFEGYKRIFVDNIIMSGYKNSILYGVLGTVVSVALTVMGAYPLSRKDLAGRNVFMGLITFTMFFGGGLIPTYLLVKDLHMLDTIWSMIIPGAVSAWNLIMARTFFETSLPRELQEAAFIDGCDDFAYFFKIVIPLSMSIIGVLTLFSLVGIWNGFFDALIYLNDKNMYPLQLVLRNILIQNTPQNNMLVDVATQAAQQRVANLIKYGSIIVASAPLMILYPFLQKYFAKGVMIGSIKG